jgi:hypothetical protein
MILLGTQATNYSGSRNPVIFRPDGWSLVGRHLKAWIQALCLILLTASGLAAINIVSHASSTATTTGVQGTVHAYNFAGDLVPIAGAQVEARRRYAKQLLSSIQTGADGNFSFQLSPGDYNLTISAAPPASNISPASIVGQVLAYATPSVVAAVGGVNVTLSPQLPERDVGGSCLTDSDGFFNLTVRPYFPIKSRSTSVRVSEGTMTSIDVDLEPLVTGQLEPSIFYITFSHPEYPVGPEYPVDHVLKISPGRSYGFKGYMNTWPTVTTTVTFQGNRYTMAVNGYSYSIPPAWNLRFDAERRLFNFTMGEPYLPGREVAEFVVLIQKPLIDGSPVVLVDNVIVTSNVTLDAGHYYVRFSYPLTQNETVTHNVTVGGSNTVPENAGLLVSLVTAVVFLHLFSRRKPEAKNAKISPQCGC